MMLRYVREWKIGTNGLKRNAESRKICVGFDLP